MDSAVQSFTARLGNVPSHKSVGKNGTFWLPTETSNSFSSKLKEFSNRNSRPSTDQQKNPSINLNAKQAKGNIQSNLISPKNLDTPKKVASSHIFQSTKSKSKSLISNNLGPQIQKNLLPNKIHSDRLLNGNNQVLRGAEKRSYENDNFLPKHKENQMLVGDKEEHDGQKNAKHHGIKDAPINNLMIITERLNLIFTQAAAVAKAENRLEEKSLKLLDNLAKELIAKIGLFEKNESVIVRMAIDLPNGSALNVRIEQKPTSLNISFITEDAETLEVIEYIGGFLAKEQNNSHKCPISVFQFKSYQEMDTFFKQAA